MRILYISSGQAPDYLCDMLFHGLRRTLGPDVVDVNRLWYMYKDEFGHGRRDKSQLYGRGFTMYGLLEEDSDVDRDDIPHKIRSGYYDLVIYGSVHRCRLFLEEVLASCRPQQILFIDGEDSPALLSQLLDWGLYFKRELVASDPRVRPIQFAIPAEKIGTLARNKMKPLAFINPRDVRTYIYRNESTYYGDYAESLFAITTKKAGWDCLRHYEIMANRCIPYFPDLEQCPSSTLVFLPKYELRVARQLVDKRGLDFFETTDGQLAWQVLQHRIETVFRRHSSTEALAHYVLETAALGHTATHVPAIPMSATAD